MIIDFAVERVSCGQAAANVTMAMTHGTYCAQVTAGTAAQQKIAQLEATFRNGMKLMTVHELVR